jgi:4-hydroxybutyrate CoA-transferase
MRFSFRKSILAFASALALAASTPSFAAAPPPATPAAAAAHAAPAAPIAPAARAATPAPQQAARGPQVVSAEQAARLVGNRVYFGTLASTPTELAAQIRQHAVTDNRKIEAFYMGTTLPKDHFSEQTSKNLHPNLFFVSAPSRDAATGKWGTRIHDDLYNLGKRVQGGEFAFDTVVVRVSPPNEKGLVSLGPTGDLTMPAVEQVLARGGKIIAEVNPNVPFTRGPNNLPYEKLAAVVHSNEPLPTLLQEVPTSIEKSLARNVASLIPNRSRSTLQVGIGAALGDIGHAVQNKRLKIFSEMGSDWLIDTIATEKPAATQATVSFLHGSELLYQVAHDNPALKVDSTLVVNNPDNIAAQKRMVAVNTALQVDLLGNSNGEEIDGRVISAPGGQPNFMKGASMAPDGKSVLAIRSLNKFGQPTTVPKLEGPVTTPSNHVDYVVTEWGATKRLRGMPDQERVYQVLSVSHPFYREQLAADALAKGMITKPRYDKLVRSVYPSLLRAPEGMREMTAHAALRGGLITKEQHEAIVASVPPGTMPDLVNIPEVPKKP